MKKQNPMGKLVELPFPVKGLDESCSKSKQTPGTTPACQNVRITDPRTGRARGSQRAGLVKVCPDQLAAFGIQDLDHAGLDATSGMYPFGLGMVFVPISTTQFLWYDGDGNLLFTGTVPTGLTDGVVDHKGRPHTSHKDAVGNGTMKLRQLHFNALGGAAPLVPPRPDDIPPAGVDLLVDGEQVWEFEMNFGGY